MIYDKFENSPSGYLVPTVYGERAYVPNSLPPKLNMGKLAINLGEAMAAIGELRGACRRLPNPYILIRPLQRLEAQTSSAMEGTYTTADELVLTEAGVGKEVKSEAREVANYIQALAWAANEIEKLPISGRLLKGIHLRLLDGVGRSRGQEKLPGQFKKDQNMIGGYKLATARFIPAPPAEAKDAISELEKYVNREDKSGSASLIDIALVHYQFETIHPFADGNGRVGRMLISLMAISENLLEMPVLYMSPDLESRKDEYIDLMYQVSSKGVWEDWVVFFLEILALSCHRAVSTIDRILSTQEEYHGRASAISRSSNMLSVVNMLFESPVIYPKLIMEKVGITDAAARNILRQLTAINILREFDGIYPAVWIAPEILRISSPDIIHNKSS